MSTSSNLHDDLFTADRPEGTVTLVSVATALLVHRRLIIGVALVCAVATAVLLLLQARTYTSAATFTPQAAKAGSNLGGLAAQFGVTVPGADPEQSPAFYVDLVSSRAILSRIVDSPLVVNEARPASARSVADLLGVKEQNPLLRREEAITRLGKAVQSTFSQKTGVVTVSATAYDPDVARALVDRIVTAVSRFNLANQQTRASAERKFTEQRLTEALGELRTAEGHAEEFLQRNREYRNAPQLALEYDRLTREIGLRQQLYNSLAQAYDKVKIDEVRDTPNITLINRAEVPVRPDPRGLARWTIVALILGALAASALALLLDYMAAQESDAEAFQQFSDVRREAARDLKRPWRLLRRARR